MNTSNPASQQWGSYTAMRAAAVTPPDSTLLECSYSWKGISWNSIVGKYMVVTTDPEISRKVFSYNDPDTLLMGVSPLRFSLFFSLSFTPMSCSARGAACGSFSHDVLGITGYRILKFCKSVTSSNPSPLP